MASENLQIDENGRNVLGAITNDASEFIKNLRVNPITGRLLVDAHLTSTNTEMGDTIPGGTAGSVLFLGLGSTLAQDNANFFYDDTNHYLGLGTDTPDSNLHVVGTFHYVDGNESNGYVLTSDASGNATWQPSTTAGGGYTTIEKVGVPVTQRSIINFSSLFDVTDNAPSTDIDIDVVALAADNTFVTNLASNNTFATSLVSNTTFTTALGNDTNFITALTSNSSFQSDIVTIINTDPSISINLSTQVTGTLQVANGGTGVTSVSQGDLLYGSATNTWSTLAKNTSATRYLSNTGTSNNPAWAQVNLANGVTGTLPVANGGTGVTAITAHYLIVGNGTSAVTLLAPSATSGIPLISQGASSDPAYGTAVVAGGGTGQTSFTAHGVLIGNGSSALSVTGTGTSGQVLTSNGASADPTFQDFAASLYTVNADETISTWYTYTVSLAGTASAVPRDWAGSGLTLYSGLGANSNGGGIATLTGTAAAISTELAGTGSNYIYQFNSGKGTRLKFRWNDSTTANNAVSGIGFVKTAADIYAAETSNNLSVRFITKGNGAGSNVAYGVVASGSGNSNSSLASYVFGQWNLIEIVFSTSNVKFYVNGTLDATIAATNIPTTADPILLATGLSGTGQRFSASTIISLGVQQ